MASAAAAAAFPNQQSILEAQFKSFKRVHQNDELIFGLSKHSRRSTQTFVGSSLKLAKLLCFCFCQKTTSLETKEEWTKRNRESRRKNGAATAKNQSKAKCHQRHYGHIKEVVGFVPLFM